MNYHINEKIYLKDNTYLLYYHASDNRLEVENYHHFNNDDSLIKGYYKIHGKYIDINEKDSTKELENLLKQRLTAD